MRRSANHTQKASTTPAVVLALSATAAIKHVQNSYEQRPTRGHRMGAEKHRRPESTERRAETIMWGSLNTPPVRGQRSFVDIKGVHNGRTTEAPSSAQDPPQRP
jgi:hypothetical protein